MTDTKAPTLDEQIAYIESSEGGMWRITTAEPVVSAILASLERLRDIEQAAQGELPEPVAHVHTVVDAGPKGVRVTWEKTAPFASIGYKLYGPEVIDRLKAETVRANARIAYEGKTIHEHFDARLKAEAENAALREKVKYYKSITTGAEHAAIDAAKGADK